MAELLTIRETAELLRVHPLTAWRWAREGKLPARQYGRAWRVDRAGLAVETGEGRHEAAQVHG